MLHVGNEIVQFDGLRHKFKMTKRAKNDLTRTSMRKKHENILQVLMTKIFQRTERLPTVSLVDEDRMNAGKNVYSELALQISAI